MADFFYNNTPSASTEFTPFFVLYGYHPRFNSLVACSGVPAADRFVENLQNIQSQLINNLLKEKLSQSKFYNKGKRGDASYNPGDLVWLSRRYIKTRRNNSKLDVRRIGPFHVRRMIGKNAAELILPANLSCLNPVFNISLLMLFISAEEVDHQIDFEIHEDFAQQFVKWASTTYILDYRILSNGVFGMPQRP